jgi:hypothetical protein
LLHNNKRKQKSNNDAIIDKTKGNITLRGRSSPPKRTINYPKKRNLLIVVQTAESRSGVAITPVVEKESCYYK